MFRRLTRIMLIAIYLAATICILMQKPVREYISRRLLIDVRPAVQPNPFTQE